MNSQAEGRVCGPLLFCISPSRRVWMQHTALSSAPLFIDDVMAESDRAVLSLRKNLAVQGDLILGQYQVLLLYAGTLTAGLSCI